MRRSFRAIWFSEMPLKKYISIAGRAFFLAAFLAAISVAGELIVVEVLRMNNPNLPFSSFYAVGMFCGLSGFLPFQPSPSRISSTPISLFGRLLLLLEFTLFVVAAMFASSQFMASRHVVVPVEISFAAYAYGLILIVMLFANFGRLRREVSASN